MEEGRSEVRSQMSLSFWCLMDRMSCQQVVDLREVNLTPGTDELVPLYFSL